MSRVMRAAFCFALCSFSAHALTPSGPSLASTETAADGVADLRHNNKNNNKNNKGVSEEGNGDVGASTGALPAARRFPGGTDGAVSWLETGWVAATRFLGGGGDRETPAAAVEKNRAPATGHEAHDAQLKHFKESAGRAAAAREESAGGSAIAAAALGGGELAVEGQAPGLDKNEVRSINGSVVVAERRRLESCADGSIFLPQCNFYAAGPWVASRGSFNGNEWSGTWVLPILSVQNYELTFTMQLMNHWTPGGGFHSILHIGSTDSQRLPGIWFHDSQNALYVMQSYNCESGSPWGDNLCEWGLTTTGVTFTAGATYEIKVRVSSNQMTVYVDGAPVGTASGSATYAVPDVNPETRVYVGDPWWPAAQVTVLGICFSPFECEQCTAGKESNPEHTQCVACEPGWVSSAGSMCAPCQAGTQSNGAHTQCVSCPDGWISTLPACAMEVIVSVCEDTDWDEVQDMYHCTQSDEDLMTIQSVSNPRRFPSPPAVLPPVRRPPPPPPKNEPPRSIVIPPPPA